MKIVLNVIKTLFCLVLIAGTIYILMTGVISGGSGGISGDPELAVGNAGKEPLSLFPDMLDKTEDVANVVASYDLSNTEDIKNAIIDLYDIGCQTWYNAPARGGRYLGSGTGGIDGQLEGKLKVFNERYYVKADSTEDNAYPYYGIEEKHNYAYEVNKPEPIASIAANMLGSARRFVYMPVGNWAWEGVANSTKFSTDGVDATFNGTPVYKNAATVKSERANEKIAAHLGTGSAYYEYGSLVPDKSNYVLNSPGAILDPTEGLQLRLTESAIDGKKVYTAEFSVNCDPKLSYTRYAAHAIGKTISSAEKIVYKKLNIKFELWESGYFRSWSSTERWEGNSTSAIKGTGFAEVTSTELYTYDVKEVVKIISEKAAVVLAADSAKPDVNSMISVIYNGQEVFK